MKTNTLKTTTSPTRLASAPSPGSGAEQVLRRVNQITDDGLRRVITGNKNILASDDQLFRHPFGRDTAISADRLLFYDKGLAWQAALLMTSTQGTENNEKTEEEPGKIFHELKFRSKSNSEQQAVFDRLRATLGIGDDYTFISYTSVDSTLEFVHMVAHYSRTYGNDILRASVRRQGEVTTVGAALVAAVEWIRRTIRRSDIGLIGAYRTNPRGVIVSDLLDGATSFMHDDGMLVNHKKEVNTLNFQSLGYLALTDAASIVTDEFADESERSEWQSEAEALRQRTIERFWMEDERRVAMAIDRDEAGRPRQLKTDSILPAVALRTGIFDDRPDIIEVTARRLYLPEMMTCVGPRTQSASLDVGYTRYQEPPWPVLVGRVVEGMIRYEYDDIAIDLIERMLMGVYTVGRAEEFHQVTRANELGVFDGDAAADVHTIAATNIPEAPQGWTVATMWWVTHEALPILAARRRNSQPKVSGVDLTLNKQVRTVPYRLDKDAALKIENDIQAAAAAKYAK